MNPYREYEIDARKVRAGVPLVIHSRNGGGSMTIFLRYAGSGNRKFQYVMAELRAARQAELESEDKEVSTAAMNEVMQEGYAFAVITGWEGVDDRNGNPLPYTPDNALDLLRACPEIWDQVLIAGADRHRYGPDTAAQDGAAVGKH